MSRRGRPRLAVVALAAAAAAWARAQDAPEAASPPAPAATLEQYLSDRGLKSPLAAHLVQQLRTADGAARAALARRISTLQVELFDEASTPEARARWERRSEELLALVPDADSIELRLTLAKARYFRAEAVAERDALRLATADERTLAVSELRALASALAEVGTRAHRQTELYEKREGGARDEELPALRALIGSSRQARAAAFYYAGWSGVYAAQMTGDAKAAEEALSALRWVLGAPTFRAASIEQVPEGATRLDHVARAALACAEAESVRGRHDAALRWVELVEGSADTPAAVKAAAWPRRVRVLARAGRWDDLQYHVDRRRGVRTGQAGPAATPLPLAEARLLAVTAFEAFESRSMPEPARAVARSLAAAGLADLTAAGELRHVAELVSRYGAAGLPEGGFLGSYVRGVQAYERARAAHGEGGRKADDPATDASTIALYREAAASLGAALASPDMDRFPTEKAAAELTAGLALFFAGDLERAADALERAHASAATPRNAEDALWTAVVALDRASRAGKPGLGPRFKRLATLFLETYPRSERAVGLLLTPSGGETVTEAKAVEVLLGIPEGSPLRPRARRHAANLLYGIYARSPAADRPVAAARFLSVAEDALRMERAAAGAASAAEAPEAWRAVVLRARQIADAAMASTPPELDRAARALDLLEGLSKESAVDISAIRGEVLFRALQVALARGKPADVARAADALRGVGGPFAARADRLLFNRAAAAMGSPEVPAETLREVVVRGSGILSAAGAEWPKDPAMQSVAGAIADAGARLWRAEKDAAARDAAIAADRRLIEAEPPPAESLRRLAGLSEDAGDAATALECWRRLLAGTRSGSSAWFEARYESLRLLRALEPERAAEAIAQHRVLYPEFGPEPWGAKLRALAEQIGPPADGGAR